MSDSDARMGKIEIRIPRGLVLDASQIGTAAAFYVAGACLGALFVGQAFMYNAVAFDALFGVKAEQRQLEDIAEPLTATEEDGPKKKNGERAHGRHRLGRGRYSSPPGMPNWPPG